MPPLIKFPDIDKITLGADHSLIAGHGPRLARKLHGLDVIENNPFELESFGLFETATPNFHTYYPDVTDADLEPKEEDFIYPVFRALSEVIVRKSWNPIDFSKNGVLKASMNKLLAQTVYANHEMMIGNEVGSVSKVFWQEAYTDRGVRVPAGINAEFKIDGKSNPNLARKILMDPPAVHSNSVTVEFAWEKSHPKMTDEDFYSMMGKPGSDKQMVRRIVSEVKGFNETSLVPHGADPYAQIIRNGKINNPQYAHSKDSLSERLELEAKRYHFFSFKDKESLSDAAIPEITNVEEVNTENQNEMKLSKSLVLLLATMAGISLTDEQQNLPDAEFQEKFNFDEFGAKLAENQAKLQSLTEAPEETDVQAQLTQVTTEKEALETELENLKTEKTTNAAKLAMVDQVLAEKLAEVNRLYKATRVGKAINEKMTATFEKASFETLSAFESQYKEELGEKYPGTCKKCGSNEISMGSAETEDELSDDTKDTDYMSVQARLADKHRLTNIPVKS